MTLLPVYATGPNTHHLSMNLSKNLIKQPIVDTKELDLTSDG